MNYMLGFCGDGYCKLSEMTLIFAEFYKEVFVCEFGLLLRRFEDKFVFRIWASLFVVFCHNTKI